VIDLGGSARRDSPCHLYISKPGHHPQEPDDDDDDDDDDDADDADKATHHHRHHHPPPPPLALALAVALTSIIYLALRLFPTDPAQKESKKIQTSVLISHARPAIIPIFLVGAISAALFFVCRWRVWWLSVGRSIVLLVGERERESAREGPRERPREALQ
jgi:hypothetical protein